MTRILLTNDDGIHSDGLSKLEAALREVGDVYTVAPASEMSGASHSLTLSRPLRIRHIDERHWTVDGTPTDCVTLALHKILPQEEWPHICVSGINHGGNLGDDASYSGTVAGALEATILGVTGVAFSLVARENYDFTHAAQFAVQIVRKVLEEGLPSGRCLISTCRPENCAACAYETGHQERAPDHHGEDRSARQGLLLDRRRGLSRRYG
jgi:5'-nucleotidase